MKIKNPILGSELARKFNILVDTHDYLLFNNSKTPNYNQSFCYEIWFHIYEFTMGMGSNLEDNYE